jgi:hypothetical protein
MIKSPIGPRTKCRGERPLARLQYPHSSPEIIWFPRGSRAPRARQGNRPPHSRRHDHRRVSLRILGPWDAACHQRHRHSHRVVEATPARPARPPAGGTRGKHYPESRGFRWTWPTRTPRSATAFTARASCGSPPAATLRELAVRTAPSKIERDAAIQRFESGGVRRALGPVPAT